MIVKKISEVLGTKVYTDSGDFFGEIEEVNLHVTLEQSLGLYVNPETGFLNHFFATTVFSGTVNNNEPEKHETVAWFSLDQVPDKLNWAMRKWFELQSQ